MLADITFSAVSALLVSFNTNAALLLSDSDIAVFLLLTSVSIAAFLCPVSTEIVLSAKSSTRLTSNIRLSVSICVFVKAEL